MTSGIFADKWTYAFRIVAGQGALAVAIVFEFVVQNVGHLFVGICKGCKGNERIKINSKQGCFWFAAGSLLVRLHRSTSHVGARIN